MPRRKLKVEQAKRVEDKERRVHAQKKSKPKRKYIPVDKENSLSRKLLNEKHKRRKIKLLAGRPTLYSPQFAFNFIELISEGRTISEIARAMGVSLATIYYWRTTQPGFSDAWERGKQLADQKVIDALYKRATGFNHSAVKLFYNAERNEVISETYTEYYPPDVQAITFWLRNRQYQDWGAGVGNMPIHLAVASKGDSENGIKDVSPQVIVTIPSNGREADVVDVESNPA